MGAWTTLDTRPASGADLPDSPADCQGSQNSDRRWHSPRPPSPAGFWPQLHRLPASAGSPGHFLQRLGADWMQTPTPGRCGRSHLPGLTRPHPSTHPSPHLLKGPHRSNLATSARDPTVGTALPSWGSSTPRADSLQGPDPRRGLREDVLTGPMASSGRMVGCEDILRVTTSRSRGQRTGTEGCPECDH